MPKADELGSGGGHSLATLLTCHLYELVFVAVKLAWEPPNDGMSRGFSADGHALAQVAQVFSAAGDEIGWLAWLVHGGELFDQFVTIEAAQAAAEAALDRELS